jgi:hypothetical protein
MTTEQFRELLTARPFRPFVIRTAGGRKYTVTHPETALQSRSGRTVVVETREDTFTIIDLLLVTALEHAANQA